ncbi:RHS repeat domain-containing protein [Pseudarcicella hirudinis]|uniref:RHS repeat domain-containing protein n=1 Tax=Pseudarcicella hirudinis TaxID=1079859 RepID=UPI0035EA90A3
MGPGDSFANYNKVVTYKYEADNGVLNFQIASDGGISNVVGTYGYPGGTLFKRTTINEQNQDVIEYVDKRGLTVQKSVRFGTGATDYAITRYIYDTMGRLRYVIPPKAYPTLPNFLSKANAILNGGFYIYDYDEKGRVIKKYIPDGGSVNMVYDQMDRVVLTQNSKQAAENKWTFFKYDKSGRNILKGEVINSSSQATLQSNFNTITNIYEIYNASGTFGYSNQSFPITINDSDVQEASYYDNYTWLGGQYGFQTNSNYPLSPYNNATGLVTGHRKRNLQNTGQILIDVNYYDDNNRVIQIQNTHILGGTNIIFNKYNFPGELISTTTIYRQSGKADVNTLTEYEMDHIGRKVKMTHKIDNNVVKTVKYYYDEIGRMSSKVIPTSAATSPAYSQLSLKVFLQGAYDANSGIMTGSLKALNLLPKNEPYSLYNKYSFIDPTENKPMANSVLNVLGSNEIVDWIVVELRDLPDRVVANKAFVLKRDGNVVNPEDGTYALKMKAPPGNYYVSIRHRNHLPVMTKFQIALSSGSATMVDLINSPTLYTSTGINTPAKIVNGKTLLWAGDANKDGQVIFQGSANDVMPIYNEVMYSPENTINSSAYVLKKVYRAEDVNMDAQVIYTGPGNDQDMILYNVVNHPENTQQSNTFVIKNPLVTNSYSDNTATGILQKTDYRYNIRGGLNCINCNTLGDVTLNTAENDLFSLRLSYDETLQYFDGNIGSQYYLSKIDNKQRRYNYSYDLSSRLTSASYDGGEANENYAMNNVSYDLNGNILSLNRYGPINTSYGIIDQLTYGYSGNSNRLSYVNDAVTGNNDVGDFRNNNTGTDDYDYWADGSLKSDKNKGITNITYNYLNLPQEITFGSGQKIVYAYDGSGNKLEKQVLLNGVLQRSTAYIQAMVYEKTGAGGTYNFYQLATDEGRAVYESNAWVYEWNYTDHLGNNRLSFREVGGVAVISQSQNYDPWGMVLKGAGQVIATTPNKFLFNGKECQTETGMYDFGARMQDPVLGRWFTIDPMTDSQESWSPYHYTYNNPVNYVDLFGLSPSGALKVMLLLFAQPAPKTLNMMNIEIASHFIPTIKKLA